MALTLENISTLSKNGVLGQKVWSKTKTGSIAQLLKVVLRFFSKTVFNCFKYGTSTLGLVGI